MCEKYEKELLKISDKTEFNKTNFAAMTSTTVDSYYCAAQIIKNDSIIFVRRIDNDAFFGKLLPMSVYALSVHNQEFFNKVSANENVKKYQMRRIKGDGACYYNSSIGSILETIFWNNENSVEFDTFMTKIIDKLAELKIILDDTTSNHKIKEYYTLFSVDANSEDYYNIENIINSYRAAGYSDQEILKMMQ